MPGLKWLTRLPRIVEAGLLSAADAETLSQLRESNALLFDLCLKRSLSLKGLSFQPSVFETRRHFVDTARVSAQANPLNQETPR